MSTSSIIHIKPGSDNQGNVGDERQADQLTKRTGTQQIEKNEHREDAASWLRVLAAFLIFVMTWGPSTGIGAFESYYQKSLMPDESPSKIAWIGSMQTFLLLSVGVIAGPLFDKGYFRIVMPIGCLLCILGFMLLSLCTLWYQVFLTQGVLFGVGTGLAYVPCTALVAVRFTKHRAIAMGLTTSGAGVGGIVFPIMIRHLIPRVGFPWTARIIGFVQLGITMIALSILLRDKPPAKLPRKLLQPEAFSEHPFAVTCIAAFFQNLAYWIPFALITDYALFHIHTGPNLSFYLLATTNAASTIGRIVPALTAEIVGSYTVFVVSTAICGVLLLTWIACNSLGAFIAFCILWGLFSGAVPSIAPVTVAVRPISPDPSVYGTRIGMVFLCGGFGILIGNPIAGALVDLSQGSFVKAQAFAGATMIASAVLFCWPWYCVERVRRRDAKLYT